MANTFKQGLPLVGLTLIGLSLTGCLFQKPAPEEVLTKFNQSAAALTSFHYDLALKLEGKVPIAIAHDVNRLNLNFSGDAASPNSSQPDFTLQAKVAGTSAEGSLSLEGELVNLSDYTYFRLTDLTLPTLLPVSLGADSRWYKIRHLAPANPNERKLGVSKNTSISPEQFQAFRDLISQANIAEVLEVLPDATVSGQRSYHYRVKLKPEAIVQLTNQLGKMFSAKITISNQDMLSRYQPEVWINKRTFQLTQLHLADIYLVNQVPVAFDFTLGLSHQNEKLTVVPPKETEELDATNLLKKQFPF
jgi:hypothetical protein